MREAPIKFSQLDRIANSAVIVILCFQFALSFASAAGMSGFERANDKDLWYTGLKSSIDAHGSVSAKWADLEPRDRQDLGFGFLTFVIMCVYQCLHLVDGVEVAAPSTRAPRAGTASSCP